ncbi:MAG: class I SAM-dependent methyltransferase [Polyangiaceae bacterium]|nr:class I SAM-dependent methyltransferase [Polyangiaceae bacterium]
MSLVSDITARYSWFESWLYDRYIAPAVEDLARTMIDRLVADDGSRALLDVGCGGGQNAALLADLRPDVRITGLDLSPEQVARAARRGARFGDRLRFVAGSALAMPFDGETFDAVYSVASIKHWPDPRRGLEECIRVLRPGGLLVVVEADRGCRLDDARRFVDRWRLPSPVRRIALPMFRTWIAGQAFDLEDTRALFAGLPLEGVSVRRIPEVPGLIAEGRRAR